MYEGPVQDLIDELGRLPGVGPKSAQRIAFHMLAMDPADLTRLQAALQRVKDGVVFCDVCGNVSEEQTCRICRDARRDTTQICVVEEPKDVVAVASPSVFGSVAMITSTTSCAPMRDISSRMRNWSGPMPDNGSSAPPST